MPISAQHHRYHSGRYYNRIQLQNVVPVHSQKQYACRDGGLLLENIARASCGPDLEIIERQSATDTRRASIKCTTAKFVFSLLACSAMASAAGMIIRDMLPIDDTRLLKTDYFEQGKMEYFADNRMEYTLKEHHDGYLLEHEKLSVKAASRSRI